jgi:hypothetical protein
VAEIAQERNNHRVVMVSSSEAPQFSVNGVCVQACLCRVFSCPVTYTNRSGSENRRDYDIVDYNDTSAHNRFLAELCRAADATFHRVS